MSFTRFFCFLLLLCYFVSPSLFGQANAGNPATAGDASLVEQFDAMVEQSNRYQRFRVVPSEWLSAFNTNLKDSLNQRTRAVVDLQTSISDLNGKVAALETQISEKEASIAELSEERDGISFLGAIISKGTYNAIVWTLVAALLGGMLFFMARGRYAVTVSKDAEKDKAELMAELDKSKRRRLEVEQDLRRKLQDEINKRNG
jgi:cell division protein FtsB